MSSEPFIHQRRKTMRKYAVVIKKFHSDYTRVVQTYTRKAYAQKRADRLNYLDGVRGIYNSMYVVVEVASNLGPE